MTARRENRVVNHVRSGSGRRIVVTDTRGPRAGTTRWFDAPTGLVGMYWWSSDGRTVVFVTQARTLFRA